MFGDLQFYVYGLEDLRYRCSSLFVHFSAVGALWLSVLAAT